MDTLTVVLLCVLGISLMALAGRFWARAGSRHPTPVKTEPRADAEADRPAATPSHSRAP